MDLLAHTMTVMFQLQHVKYPIHSLGEAYVFRRIFKAGVTGIRKSASKVEGLILV